MSESGPLRWLQGAGGDAGPSAWWADNGLDDVMTFFFVGLILFACVLV